MQTPRQKMSRQRNFTIFQLKGMLTNLRNIPEREFLKEWQGSDISGALLYHLDKACEGVYDLIEGIKRRTT
jgi:hypothetical protein